MRRYIACFLTVLVVGCTSINTAESPAQRLYALQGEFNIALQAATTYLAQPPCSDTVVTGCHDPEVKARIQKAATEAYNALEVAKATIGTGQGAGYVALAGAAVGALVQYLTAKGVGQ